jgi:hypothetical protein
VNGAARAADAFVALHARRGRQYIVIDARQNSGFAPLRAFEGSCS